MYCVALLGKNLLESVQDIVQLFNFLSKVQSDVAGAVPPACQIAHLFSRSDGEQFCSPFVGHHEGVLYLGLMFESPAHKGKVPSKAQEKCRVSAAGFQASFPASVLSMSRKTSAP